MSSGLLLDTHIFLWWQLNDPRLMPTVRARIAETPRVFVSAASVWEATIKAALGRLVLPEPMAQALIAAGFTPLPIECTHAERAGNLPLHHADPFDRMLIAQAQVERLTLVTHDDWIRSYDVMVLMA